MNVLKWLGYIVLLGLFIWFVFFRKLGLFSSNSNPTSVNTEQTTLDNQVEENGGMIDDAFVDETTENAPVVEDFPAVTTPKAETQRPAVSDKKSNSIDLNQRYLIIVGSFGKRANAERMLKRVKKDGNAGVITTVNGMHRVVTGSTDDLANAKNLRNHFTHIYKETAFILEN